MPGSTPDAPTWLPAKIECACRLPLHPQAVHGIELFNSGLYFEAHEALETAWRAEPGPRRDLYRAILLAGVALLYIQRGNHAGAVKVAQRALRWLACFPDSCCGVQLGSLNRQMQAVLERLLQQDDLHLKTIDLSVVSPIHFDPTWPESDAIIFPEKE